MRGHGFSVVVLAMMATTTIPVCFLPSALSLSPTPLRLPATATARQNLQWSSSTTRRTTVVSKNTAEPSDNNKSNKTSQVFQASLLIAGTTVGGGFLALPQIVHSLGGFVTSAISLGGVWLFFFIQSLVLCDCFRRCHEQTTKNDKGTVIGIPLLVKYALGPKGAALATTLLLLSTEATLVSQLSRAGTLFTTVGTASMVGMGGYRLGCIMAGVLGATLTLGAGSSSTLSPLQDNQPVPVPPKRFAVEINAGLTMVFLVSAVLMFAAGSQHAMWSHCFNSAASSVSTSHLAAKVLHATPTMLQLLAYGEILPNVCHMLDYDSKAIRTSLVLGSVIPLLFLTGWAGLGVAIQDPIAIGGSADPVQLWLASTGTIRNRLLVLAMSAIGTTILGSYLALESAYRDLASMIHSPFLRRPWVAMAFIVGPPLAISVTSPNVFLRAIDFAGSYPVLLLFGVIPPVMALRLRNRNSLGQTVRYAAMALLSLSMVAMNAVPDLRAVVTWIIPKFITSFL